MQTSYNDDNQINEIPTVKYLKKKVYYEKITKSEFTISKFSGFNSKIKKFKDKSLEPNITINWILMTIKEFLKNTSLKPIHFPQMNIPLSTWTTRGSIYNEFYPIFSAMGKGMTLELSMASFYGELIERIQEGRIFSNNPYKQRIYYFNQNHEKSTSNNDYCRKSLNQKFIDKLRSNSVGPLLTDCLEIQEKKEFSMYNEYYDLFSGRYIEILNSINHSTTGLASGNSYEEAFLQGLFELIERYCSFIILRNSIKLPTIENKKCSSIIQNLIKEIEKIGFEITIKDASLNLEIPCVAVIFTLKNDKLCSFTKLSKSLIKFGAASSLEVAVERCITEALQSADNLLIHSSLNFQFVEYIRKAYEKFPQLHDIISIHDLFVQSYSNKGYFPSDELKFLFENKKGKKIIEFDSVDLKDEIDYIFNLFKKLKYKIYIKDYNWLGFPTIKVFIPDLNTSNLNLKLYTNQKIEDFKRKIIKNISLLKIEDLEILNEPYFLFYCCFNPQLSEFFSIDTISLDKYNTWLFFSELTSIFGLKQLSNKFMELNKILNKDIPKNIKNIPNKKELLEKLRDLIPNCLESCEKCLQNSQCKYIIQSGLMKKTLKKYSSKFLKL